MSLNKYVHSFTKIWMNKWTLLTSEVAPKEPRQNITEFNLLIIPQIFAKHFLCVRYLSTDWGYNSEQKEPSKSLTWGIFTPEPLKHSLPISSRNRGINITLFFAKTMAAITSSHPQFFYHLAIWPWERKYLISQTSEV